MIFELATDLVSGGWDALTNVTQSIGQGASSLVSGFFPAPQRNTIVSETVQAAGGAGQTYRATAPDTPSMFETLAMQADEWIGSPYEMQYAVPEKIKESKQIAASVSAIDPIGALAGGLDWALQQTAKVVTLYDQLSPMWEPRETIVGQPREGYPEGRDVQNLNDIGDKAAAVVTIGKAKASEFVDQIKGLFGLGYTPTQKQPALAVRHELQPASMSWTSLGIVAAVIVVVILLGRKK